MRIVHFGKYYSPDFGGVESVTQIAAEAAVERGDAVSVVCFGRGKISGSSVINGVNVIRCSSINIFSQPISIDYLRNCLKSSRSADVVHIHWPNYLAAVAALFLRKKNRIVLHWHSDVVGRNCLAMLFRQVESELINRSQTIIVTSKTYALSSRHLVKSFAKMTVVPIGVKDRGRGLKAIVGLPECLRKLRDTKIVLSVGRLVGYKDFETLIYASGKVDEQASVVIVGTGPLKASLQRLIIKLGLTERVYILSGLCEEHVDYLYSRAALLCMPSKNRGDAFGVVLVEAMSHSLPLVATNVSGSGMSWINQHGVTGFNVPPSDADELSAAINAILRNPRLHKFLSENARARYEAEFSLEIFRSRLFKVYDNVDSFRKTSHY